MSFNDIVLPRTVIGELYKNSLVELKSEEKAKNIVVASHTPGKPVHYLGNNNRNILVLVNYPEEVFLPEEQLEFLTKILAACKLGITDIALINTAKQPLNSLEYLTTLKPAFLLIFGDCAPNIVKYSEAEFFIPTYLQGTPVITAPALDIFYMATSESKQLKKKLWSSLQQFFKL